MRIGIFTPPNAVGKVPVNEMVDRIVQAEQDGFSSYWLVQLPSTGNDVLTTIALAGQKTTRIELGTAVIPVYTRHPLVMAQQAATTQAMTNGRLALGLGLSHKPVIEDMMGLSYKKPARYMREYLSVLQPLIHDRNVDFHGQVFNVTSGLHVPNATPFPVFLAALAPLMLQIAGELADGTITWMAGRKTIKTHIAPKINAAAQAAGRPRPRICVTLPIAVTDDHASARDHVSVALQRYGKLENYRRLLDIEGADGPADVAVFGNEAQVTEQLQAFIEAGATEISASIFPVGEDAAASEARTISLLKKLNGDGY